jgi:hypothetical protein
MHRDEHLVSKTIHQYISEPCIWSHRMVKVDLVIGNVENIWLKQVASLKPHQKFFSSNDVIPVMHVPQIHVMLFVPNCCSV